MQSDQCSVEKVVRVAEYCTVYANHVHAVVFDHDLQLFLGQHSLDVDGEDIVLENVTLIVPKSYLPVLIERLQEALNSEANTDSTKVS